MSVNTGLSTVSDHLLMVAVVIYSLALLAYAGDFAYGRRVRAAAKPVAQPVAELAGVGARAADEATVAGEPAGANEAAVTGGSAVKAEAAGAGADDGAGADGGAGDSPAISPGGLEKGRQARGPLIRAAIGLTFLGAALHLTGVITRGIAVDRVPWGDMYEFVTALTCVAAIFFLFAMIRYRAWTLGVFVMGAVVVTLGLAETLIYTAPGDLVPALQSYWLDIHVTAMTLATGIFFVAAVLGVMYLVVERYRARVAAGKAQPGNGLLARIPSAAQLDKLTYRTVVFGFPVWTFGVIAGAIWADQAWGRYWGWDPVETWAFITWVLYAAFLHARATAGWRGRRAHYVQLLGFVSLIFNIMVVQIFIAGLHSYSGVSG